MLCRARDSIKATAHGGGGGGGGGGNVVTAGEPGRSVAAEVAAPISSSPKIYNYCTSLRTFIYLKNPFHYPWYLELTAKTGKVLCRSRQWRCHLSL